MPEAETLWAASPTAFVRAAPRALADHSGTFLLRFVLKATVFYLLDTNQGHPFSRRACSAPVRSEKKKKQNKIKGKETLWPTICWSTGRGHSADTNAWMHFAGVPCDPSFHGGIHWENRLHWTVPATAANGALSVLLLQD